MNTFPAPDTKPLISAARRTEDAGNPLPNGVVVNLPIRCAWCARWRVDLVWTAQAPAASGPAKVSHGICPECARKMKEAA